MSEFIKKLDQVFRGNEQPIGFGPKSKEKTPAMLLIARIGDVEESIVGEAIDGGADAVLFNIENPVSKLEVISQLAGSLGKTPWGMRLSGNDCDEIEKLVDAGCDFVVTTTEVPAQLLLDDKLGKVLETDSAFSDSLAEVINKIPVDAVLFSDSHQSSTLTIGQLLEYHRICSFSEKIALVNTPQNNKDIEVLYEAGVGGILVNLSVEGGNTKLTEIKQTIQEYSGSKRKERGENRS